MYQGKFREKNPASSTPRGSNATSGMKPYNQQFGWQKNNGSQNNKTLYCVFCEIGGSHSTGWCKVQKYTKAYKEGKLLKHNCCFSCLRTTDHKADTCPYRKECGICRRFHHFNIHQREDIIKYYKSKGKQKQWLGDENNHPSRIICQQQKIQIIQNQFPLHTLVIPINKTDIRIVLDSGSSHTFVNKGTAEFL